MDEIWAEGNTLQEELIRQWEAEEMHSFQGWDFSHLDGRWEYPEPPWDYKAIIKSYLKETDKLLDMGTGGGEFLLTLEHLPKNTYATEAYVPNFELCKKTLTPLGITVVQTYTDDKLPFEDGFFDIIINRHESFELDEVNRTLKHGGYFITQQVGNKNNNELMQKLNDNFESYLPHHTITNYTDTLTSMGYEIIQTEETTYPMKFFDVGALVFFAKTIVWEYPGFSVKSHLQKLLALQKELEENGSVLSTEHRFLIVARKREH